MVSSCEDGCVFLTFETGSDRSPWLSWHSCCEPGQPTTCTVQLTALLQECRGHRSETLCSFSLLVTGMAGLCSSHQARVDLEGHPGWSVTPSDPLDSESWELELQTRATIPSFVSLHLCLMYAAMLVLNSHCGSDGLKDTLLSTPSILIYRYDEKVSMFLPK